VRRALTTFDITCIGVNAIVGSGIYLFPGKLSTSLGAGSIVAWISTGALCLPLALTFAALGALEERTGGPVRYTELAFGRAASFVVGWSAWVTSVVSWAAVASGLPRYLAVFVPSVADGAAATGVSGAIIVVLAALNVVGVKPGARVAVALTLGKLVPLVLFVILGLFSVEIAAFGVAPAAGFAELPALALMTMFAYQGFEVVGVPAGEVKDPRRAVPRAVVASILATTLLYVLVQVVFVGVGGRSTSAPLPDAARSFLGAGGAALLGAGGLISMLGFNAGTAFSTPRYLQALGDERLVPPIFARYHARFETPAAAIVATASVALALTFVLDFGKLVDFAVLAVLCQYLATAAALVRLGNSRGKKLLGAVAFAVSIAFGVQCEPSQFVALGAVLAAGALVALATRAVFDRPNARSPNGASPR
jgi:APA family basic amino acid/polyamine antiporter